MSDSPRNRALGRASVALALSVLGLGLASSPAAAATSVTIGQLAPVKNLETPCTTSPFDLLQSAVSSGPSYVVPAGGAMLTSWTTYAGIAGPGRNSGAGNGQVMEMKVFREVADPIYTVVGHDEHLLKEGLNTFATNIAVKPGDVLGLNAVNASSTAPEACIFHSGGAYLDYLGDLADGDQASFSPAKFYRLNIQAVVQLAPGKSPSGPSAFSFGKVKDHRNGTATLTVNVSGPGSVELAGSRIKTQRPVGATASKAVNAAGPVQLLVKPKRKTKHKLNRTGKAKVKVSETYTPSGGNPATQSKRVKLVKKR